MLTEIISFTHNAYAQAQDQGFFEKYLNIAKLFDDPIFFGVVVGSGLILLVSSIFFIYVMKAWENKIGDWGNQKSNQELVDLLESSNHTEAKKAFAYLRKNGNTETANLLVNQLKLQRESGKYNPATIYLLEDLEAFEAIPLLEQIANGKSKVADQANRSLAHIKAAQEQAEDNNA